MTTEPERFRLVPIEEYLDAVRPTDRLAEDDLRPVLLGLLGEVGSIMAAAKKLHREGRAYVGYRLTAEEEFGDALWYLAALARRTKASLLDVFSDAMETGAYASVLAASDAPQNPTASVLSTTDRADLSDALLDLGAAAAALLTLRNDPAQVSGLMARFAVAYLEALQRARLSFPVVVRRNLEKTRGRFVTPPPESLPRFDDAFDEDERLPSRFEIEIVQRKSGQSYMRWNGVFIGDPLTDNILDPDGYRFHDVFHFAHAAVLHWSPTFRALIKHKRKTDKVMDEAQDGGRAIVVEEGLTAWVFSRAKELAFFDGQTEVSFDMLKTVGQFVAGYEVAACPLKLWEDAILQGYSVFRQVRAHQGGIVIGDRNARAVKYRPRNGGGV